MPREESMRNFIRSQTGRDVEGKQENKELYSPGAAAHGEPDIRLFLLIFHHSL